MAEDNNGSFDDNSANDLTFEQYVKNQFELIVNRLKTLEAEMVERFVQLSRQVRDVDTRVGKVEERVQDIDYKLDDFIKEQIRMKREWREFREGRTTQ